MQHREELNPFGGDPIGAPPIQPGALGRGASLRGGRTGVARGRHRAPLAGPGRLRKPVCSENAQLQFRFASLDRGNDTTNTSDAPDSG